MITFVLVLLICVLTVNAVTLQAKNKDYKQQEAELKAQISEQKERAKEVKEYEEYVKTDEYIKEVAEEKLGLVDPDEIENITKDKLREKFPELLLFYRKFFFISFARK